jgi:hypothetical protein
MTIVEAFSLAHLSSYVSHLVCCARASPVLQVVSSLPMSARAYDVETPCTGSCSEGQRRWNIVTPGIRWRKWEISLLREVAFILSMVVNMW